MGFLKGLLLAVLGLFTITFTGWTILGGLLGLLLVAWGLLEMFGAFFGGSVRLFAFLVLAVLSTPFFLLRLLGVNWAREAHEDLVEKMEVIEHGE